MRRQTGETPERLAEGEANPCPEVLRYLWNAFCALGIRRRYDSKTGTPEAISASELRDWLFLRGYDLRAWEVEALDGLERLLLNTIMIKGK